MVQPDLVVVCDRKQISLTHIEGPPALVVEIESPSSLQHDRLRKLKLYGGSGIREYWLVTPWPPLIQVLKLSRRAYQVAGVYSRDDVLTSPSFKTLRIPLNEVFSFPVSDEEKALEVRSSPPPYRR